MGNNQTKAKLTENDFKFYASVQFGFTKDQIKSLFNKFHSKNPNGQLDKTEFRELYQSLRPEPSARLDEISDYVFRLFDKDKNGSITNNELPELLKWLDIDEESCCKTVKDLIKSIDSPSFPFCIV